MARAWAAHPLVAFAGHRGRIAFYRQFHSLVRSGVGMPVALKELARHAPGEGMRRALRQIARDVGAGAGLAEAMQRHAGAFDDATMELLAFAEETGTLEPVLKRVVEHLDEMQKLRWQAIFGSLWPVYLLAAIVFVAPLFDVAGAASSGSGAADGKEAVVYGGTYLLGVLRNLALAALAIGAILGFPFALAVAGLESRWERLTLAVPLVGGAVRNLVGARFFLSMGLAVGAGVDLIRSVRLAIRASGSASVLERIDETEASLRGGSTLTDAVLALRVFDPNSLGSLSVAERTGTLEDALRELAEDHRSAALRSLRILMLIALGLVALVALGFAVAKILGTIFGPIRSYFELYKTIE